MFFSAEIFTGVFSGVLTALLLLILKKFWMETLSPFYKNMKYSGVQISGHWSEIQHGDKNSVADAPPIPFENEFRLDIDQYAHTIKGNCITCYKDEVRDFNINFTVVGHLWEGYVALNFIPVDKRIMSYSTALLKIAGGGTHLEGIYLYRNVNDEIVQSLDVSLTRKEKIDGGHY